MNINKNIAILFSCLLFAACSGTRHLPMGDKLYTGAVVEMESADEINEKQLEAAANRVLRPKPNTSVLGMRPKLWLYNISREEPRTRLGKWIRNRSEPPVLLSEVRPGVTSEFIDARLFNLGVFNASTQSKVVEKENTAKVIYTSRVHKPYVINDFVFDITHQGISELLISGKKRSLIKSGETYKLDILRAERSRIDALLKNKGYYYFKPDYLVFEADTLNSDQAVSLRLMLSDNIPPEAMEVFYIDKIIVDQNYSLTNRQFITARDTIEVNGVYFAGNEEQMPVKPVVITDLLFLRKGEPFSRFNHTATLSRLMQIENYKLVQANFSNNADSSANLLDVDILMTPMPRYSFRVEMDMVSKSNNYAGPRLNLSIQNRNAFRGAEMLNFRVSGSYEAQFGGISDGLYSYSLNPQLELIIPRLAAPINFNKRLKSMYVPRTSIMLSYNFISKANYFNMSTFKFAYGFTWKDDIKKDHSFKPVELSFSSLRNESDEFIELLETNPFLKKSYEEQFIAGANYSFIYNEQVVRSKKLQWFFQSIPEIAGNTLALFGLLGGQEISPENPAGIAGNVFSQFARFSLDSRMYYNLNERNSFAFRFFGGVGRPYGNSGVLPYTKQFFSGGPNSIRAFHINSVGPGDYFQDTYRQGFLQIGGDIKLEMNAEYRFTIYEFLKGALFVDAGNVWLLPSSPANAGAPFAFSDFTNQLAVGAGFGARLDVSFFVLRFDLATPLRKPWLNSGSSWVFDQMSPGSSVWRSENLLLNVAIGYPF
jgi:hypothetical protein